MLSYTDIPKVQINMCVSGMQRISTTIEVNQAYKGHAIATRSTVGSYNYS